MIKGVGTSSDGRFKSVYAPRASGQALAMNRAYDEAGYEAKTVGLVEAHGTGTGAGDPTEFNSMRMVFEKNNEEKQHIALGSVKSQIGHTKAAAGAAGMIKAVLSLHHKVLPPTINVAQPNSKFDIKNSPIYINTETRPWLRNGHPRRASVSAFGFGGINVHITMEEYQVEQQMAYRLHLPYKSIVLFANSPSELLNLCKNNLKKLQAAEAEATFSQIVEESEKAAIPASAARLGFVTHSLEEAIDYLKMAMETLQKNSNPWQHPKGIYFRPNALNTSGKVVALFPGQGSQYVGMGTAIANAFPPMQQAFQEADQLFYRDDKTPLSKTVFPIPAFSKTDKKIQQANLTKTQNAQAAIGAMSMGLFHILKKAGFEADFAAGHSFGELSALWAAGVYDDATFLALAKARGEAMATQNPNADSGMMLAVKAPFTKVEQEVSQLQGVRIANLNSSNQVVLGGSTTAIRAARQYLKNQGITAIPLSVSAAFHTEFVGHAQRPFEQFVSEQLFKSPQISVYSNTTAKPYPNAPFAIKSILQKQMLNPVLFKNQIENIYRAGGRIFVEFGPKGVLTSLVKDILEGKDFEAIALNPNHKKDSDLQFRQAIVHMRVLGLPLTEVDKFKTKSPKPIQKTKLNVQLGGHNYVSPKTQKAYADALSNGFQISSGAVKLVEKEVVKEVEKIVKVPVEKIVEIPVEKVVEKIIYSNHQANNPQQKKDMNKEILQLLQATLEHFKTQQIKSLEIFERFLSEQNQQSQQLLQMIANQLGNAQSQNTLNIPKPSAVPNLPSTNGNKGKNGNGKLATESLTNGATTLPPIVEEQVAVKAQVAAPSTNVQKPKKQQLAIQQVAVPAVSISNETANALNKKDVENILLVVISEKTGYPAEMLELDMDMEADLGIDSIKRVEIFGSMTETYPDISGINPQELTELRTLGQIVDYIGENSRKSKVNSQQSTIESQSATGKRQQTISAPIAAQNEAVTNGLAKKDVENILLAVISEKTGYPAEMLELDMDMEADLGIDSIKRVEIFGSMTESYPDISDLNPQELTELRTLQQIVNYIALKGKKKVATY